MLEDYSVVRFGSFRKSSGDSTRPGTTKISLRLISRMNNQFHKRVTYGKGKTSEIHSTNLINIKDLVPDERVWRQCDEVGSKN